MQIPILSGIYTDNGPDVRTSYPVNMVPTPAQSGVSNGYLRPADGIVQVGVGPGLTRGGIYWPQVAGAPRDLCFRVMGDDLVSVSESGTFTTIGAVGTASNQGPVSFDYGPPLGPSPSLPGGAPQGLLAVVVDGALFFYDGTTLQQVTDPDLGFAKDVCWVDGYFMTTDGEFLVVTELTDPFSVDPLKYGSAEADPDPIVAIVKLRNEVYALNRNTIECFDNVGGNGFPFARIEGAQIQKGCVGTRACCVFVETIAFLGSGRNEAPGIYLGASGSAAKISTAEIDRILAGFTEQELSQVVIEARNNSAHQCLYVHLPDRTLAYDAAASSALGDSVWFVLTSALTGLSAYRARHFVWAYGRWLCGDPTSTALGEMSDTVSTHYGDTIRWEFSTPIIYNESRGAVIFEMELVALTGRVALGANPTIATSYSLDGQAWSQDRTIAAGTIGDSAKRLCWFQQGILRSMRMQRFRGTSTAHIAAARLEMQIEPLRF